MADFGQGREQFLIEKTGEYGCLTQHLPTAGLEFLLRPAAIQGKFAGSLLDLALQATHSLHEELGMQHAHNSGKPDPLHQWKIAVGDQRQNPAGKPQPAQLSIDVRLRRFDVHFSGKEFIIAGLDFLGIPLPFDG